MGYLAALAGFVLFAYLFPIVVGRLRRLPSPAAWWRGRRAARQGSDQDVVQDTVLDNHVQDIKPEGDVDVVEHGAGLYSEPSDNYIQLIDTSTLERREWLRHAPIPAPGKGRIVFQDETAAKFSVTSRTIRRDIAALEEEK